jgi:hypothetical protein
VGEEVTHSYRFVIQEQFVHMQTRSEFRAEQGGAVTEVHEDWGMFSFDADRGRLILRQFLSEGLVNTYVLQESSLDDTRLDFVSESTEGSGGMSARLIFSFEGDDAYRLVLELAQPGKDFFECQNLSMKRGQ